MSGQKKLCLSCMSAVSAQASACPVCGYNGTQKNPQQDLPIGYRLRGRYVVGREKEHEGDCVTYAGYDCSRNAVVEIKEFLLRGACKRGENNALVANPDAELQYKTAMIDFCELYRNLFKLSEEPTVIQVVDFFEANQTAYAVLENFHGVSLREFLDMVGTTLPFDKCLTLLTPVLDALSRIHSVNLIHRGVSPETIFVNRNGDVKLGGYATSSVRTKDTEVVARLFSGYSAPEQYSSTMWQNASTDVYGAAAVFYRCLIGVAPQDASQRRSYDTLEPPITLQSTVPQYASHAIMMGLLLNNKERVQTALDFKRLLNGEQLPQAGRAAKQPAPQPAEPTQQADPVKVRPHREPRQSAPATGRGKAPRRGKQQESGRLRWWGVVIVVLAMLAVVAAMVYVGTRLLDELNPQTPGSDQQQTAVPVPQYTGTLMSDIAFDRENFKYEFIQTNVPGETDKMIVNQSPEPGEMVEPGTTILLYYNEPEKIKMIGVVGMSQANAEAALQEQAIRYVVREEPSSDRAPGTVIRQSIAEGEEINAASQTVTIYVAIAYAAPETPPV